MNPFHHLACNVLEVAGREELLRLTKTFIRVEQIIDSVYDLSRLLELVMRESELAVDAETSSLLLYDNDTEDLYFEVALGPKGSEVKKVRLPVDEESIAGYSALHQVSVNIQDVAKDRRWNRRVDERTQFRTRSLLAVPMLRQDRLIGVIEVLNKKGGGPFTEEDVNILMVLACLAAIAIENAQLYQKNLQAERLAVLGTAVANISHYIKNILTGLKGSITLIDAAVKEKEYGILERATLVLRRSHARIENLVKDMLSYSKGKDLNPVETDVNRVAREAHDLMVESAGDKEIDIDLVLDESIPPLMVDPELLEGVLLNLLTNSIDAVYEQMQINSNLKGKITITTRYRDENLMLRVEDNGTGIPEESLPKIWNAFYTTKGGSGTGLGLAVSKKLVEESGGTLDLTTKPGCGTSFDILLPAPVAGRIQVS